MRTAALRKEILRLAQISRAGVCIPTQQLSGLYNVPETQVRKTLAELAEQRLISLAGWDRSHLRTYSAQPSSEELLNCKTDGGRVHVRLPVD